MAMQSHDMIIRGGTVVTAEGSERTDVAIQDGKIVAVGEGLGSAVTEIDASGRLVMPGGVDSHCHIEQLSGAGLMNADTFETATRSALMGGTTTTISFAAQHPGQKLSKVVADYQALAAKGAIGDHAFHIIVSDLSGGNLTEDLPALLSQGHRSIKLFTVYDKVRMGDEDILDVLWCARAHGGLVNIHSENDGLIRWMVRRLVEAGQTGSRFHPVSHPRAAEIEALNRMCIFAEFTGQPVMLFHISCAEGAEIVRAARARGAPILAETCPHYLFMTADQLNLPGNDAAGLMCSPPQRAMPDQDALWQALEQGDLQVVSSDHAPYRLDETGKFAHGVDAPFPKIANGMPGLETRLPLMFDAMVSQGRIGPERFVELTSTNPAEIYGLPGKGRIAPGADADIVLWDPDKTVTFGVDDLHDNTGYNPYAGRSVTGWPETVLSRGEVVVDHGKLLGQPGRGRRLPMEISPHMRPQPNPPADLPS
ncbi:dihydropyrimidinase [Roseobacter sp. HKCCD9010]|uniref:dihydropyrimidinase n=1 Tax=unclassified Roseobacter TaxID=196798 RepID=UPI0014912C76|nr:MULTISPECIES: dihydropyrimidinase [unclassified Roseobacter]MBF9048518.1 dihydropyrimidinase [Rhodobacterales bacterium HKCCD4356]NNV10517.1 dihydropyrimidinase [Roseobacter sp. HKCCD7357]NNV14702.1 dihydropyrimidinase [Roseobacter sp. HKCCD8768]NNV24161.1 dihydropyrimidinase [Roseobacter sp. HKCCD8192]NNV28418.1 dihydropyrimidinase [Roseobacter sp. HKCCD9061]